MKYADKLKDPRWQKRRLEIMQRDYFTCQWCGANDKTLTVHHWHYGKVDPWDVPATLLITLCLEDHERADRIRKDAALRTAEIVAMAPGEYFSDAGVPREGRFISWITGCLMVGGADAKG